MAVLLFCTICTSCGIMSGLQYGLHTNFVKSLYFISFLWNSLCYKSLLKLRNFFYPKASHIPWNFTFRLPSLITDILLIDFQLSNGHWKTVCCHCQRTLWMTSDSHWKTVCCHCQRTLWPVFARPWPQDFCLHVSGFDSDYSLTQA